MCCPFLGREGKCPGSLRKCQDSPGTIPGQSREHFVFAFPCLFVLFCFLTLLHFRAPPTCIAVRLGKCWWLGSAACSPGLGLLRSVETVVDAMPAVEHSAGQDSGQIVQVNLHAARFIRVARLQNEVDTKDFFRGTNFLTKNALIFSPKMLSLYFVGEKKSCKIPANFPPQD